MKIGYISENRLKIAIWAEGDRLSGGLSVRVPERQNLEMVPSLELYLLVLSTRGNHDQVNRSSYERVMAEIPKLLRFSSNFTRFH